MRGVQVVISPRNYFLFTPLLPSVAVGTISPRSIIQPTRYLTRHKKRAVSVIEAEATEVDVRRPPGSFLSPLTTEIAREEDCNIHRYAPADATSR